MEGRNKIKKDKQLLLKDLSSRLQYGVIGQCEIDASYDTSFDTIFQTHKFNAVVYGIKEDLLLVTPLIEDKDEQEFANEEVADGVNILDFKPYLRPMSSITEEEISDLQKINSQFWFDTLNSFAYIAAADDGFCSVEQMDNILNYLDSKYLDYRNLIPKGLAIKVTEENNPYSITEE